MEKVILVKDYNPKNDTYDNTFIGHAGKMAFSFLSVDNEMVGPFVDCKEFLNSRVFGSIIGGESLDYRYKPTWGKVDLTSTRLLISKVGTTQKDLEKEVKLALDLINQLEKDLGLILSTAHKVKGLDKRYGASLLIIGSKRWLLAPPMINLYAYLLRNSGTYHKVGEKYLTSITKFEDAQVASLSRPMIPEMVKWLVKKKYWKVFGKNLQLNWPKTVETHQIGYCGIIMFSSDKYDKASWPHWLPVPQLETSKAA